MNVYFNPVMSGSINPESATSCIIVAGGSGCNLNFNWSVINPKATPTALTSTGLSNVNVSNNLTTPQSGTDAMFLPPGSNRFVFLYNNGVKLAETQVSATCTSFTTWNNSTCAYDRFSVTPSYTGNGSVTPYTSQSVIYNTTQSFTVVPSAGYTTSVGGTCPTGSFSGTTYTTGKINVNCTVSFTFSSVPVMSGTLTPPSTTCTVSAGGSSCNVNLSWTVINHESFFSAITANGMIDKDYSGVYSGTDSFVVPAGGRTFYLYNNAKSLAQKTVGTICATDTDLVSGVCRSKLTITSSAGVRGDINPSGGTSVTYGSNQTYTIISNTGYMLDVLTVDGVTVVDTNSYTFSNVTTNHTISATF